MSDPKPFDPLAGRDPAEPLDDETQYLYEDAVRRMPNCELHLHHEGAGTADFIRQLAKREICQP